MTELDIAITALDVLQHRQVICQLARLATLQCHALANTGIKHTMWATKAMMAICSLSDGAKNVLEAAIRE